MIVRFGRWVFDAERRQVADERGESLHLTRKAFDLLGLLITAAPRVVSKTEIHERLWPRTFVSEATLLGLVKELRRTLQDRDAHAPLIRTSHGVGYAFSGALITGGSTSAGLAHWLVARDRRIPLSAGENVIGRDPAATVWLDVAGVSRRHARIMIDSRHAWLEDLGSKNGTRLRGEPLMVRGTAILHDGDDILVGMISLVYRASDSGLSTETLGASNVALS